MEIKYQPHGVCSRQIIIDVEDGIVNSVKFVGGCSGNTQGVAALAKGMKVDDVIDRLEGIRCNSKPTSCPDQLAKALKENAR
ncbi:TIGR03905 family protein [Erysipelatoclostridium sp. An173]|uniref:ribonucleoside-diphosphate reductase n=1 Tax=Candidatus Erysipelatoclostridium merdavium TaxID=2838566 RepID=A0A9D2BN20_9FIRM|nr:TIGR03905 family TSCPD domain-containing protein [Erysipelatoclostridium sp. An173]OUP77793.1 TIGR03905 family protein [Erysipelatoclostridium sp. An173]HIX82048.1 TIGR03905 family TSCPD domain-containing protein [Candidatus Erysipelatoclostridium merdavium]